MDKRVGSVISKWRFLFCKNSKNSYVVSSDSDFHCKEGTIKKECLNNYGIIKSSSGKEFFLSGANFYDIVKKLKRGPQLVIEKDLGYVVSRCRLSSDSVIVEAGGGMGGATTFFGNLFKRVISYEKRPEFVEIIKNNVKLYGLENVEIREMSIEEGIESEALFELLFLDLPSPESVFKKRINLRDGFYAVVYLPSISQVQSLVSMIENGKSKNLFIVEEVSEVILRKWRVSERVLRPEHRKLIDHTAFLVFLRKIY